MTRFLAAVLMSFALTGCGMVASERPLFGVADTVGAPAARDGLWALVEPGCKLNLQSAPAKWPDCSHAILLRDGMILDPTPDPRGQVDDPVAYQVVSGEPAIVQVSASSQGVGYVYFGFRPLAVDSAGAVTAARVWPALCSRPVVPGGNPGKPLVGLIVTPGGHGDCEARRQGPLRNAVIQSEPWSELPQAKVFTAKWIKDVAR